MLIIMNNLKKYTIADILMDIHDMECVFLKTDTMEIVNPWDYLKKYLPDNLTEEDYEKLPSKVSLNIYPLPIYEFIDDKSIMSEFVKNIWDDKQTRQELFYILRNHNYMDKFYDCLKKHDLYEEYRDYSADYYNYVFREWCEKHNINF